MRVYRDTYVSRRHKEPDPIAALRELAPKGMPWLCFTSTGHGFWQPTRGHSDMWWSTNSRLSGMHSAELSLSAIHLPTGTVHLQQPDGTIIEVTRKEWDV